MLMASGQDPALYAIPALQPIVSDLFVVRRAAKEEETCELDTQREYVISMHFHILLHPEVVEMLASVVRQARVESEERWRRVSRQMMDHVLPRVTELLIESRQTLDVLHALFDSLHTSVFRPLDDLLRARSSPLHRRSDPSSAAAAATPQPARDANTSAEASSMLLVAASSSSSASSSSASSLAEESGCGIPGANVTLSRWLNLVLVVISSWPD